jgi:hypothetical protein
MTTAPNCTWCSRRFVPRKIGGHEKRFCSADCRAHFHTALRQWAARALAGGHLSVSDLKATRAVVHDAVDGQFGGSTLASIPPRG